MCRFLGISFLGGVLTVIWSWSLNKFNNVDVILSWVLLMECGYDAYCHNYFSTYKDLICSIFIVVLSDCKKF